MRAKNFRIAVQEVKGNKKVHFGLVAKNVEEATRVGRTFVSGMSGNWRLVGVTEK